jgi:hypothetical protein
MNGKLLHFVTCYPYSHFDICCPKKAVTRFSNLFLSPVYL